jgi:hypothetical protein
MSATTEKLLAALEDLNGAHKEAVKEHRPEDAKHTAAAIVSMHNALAAWQLALTARARCR